MAPETATALTIFLQITALVLAGLSFRVRLRVLSEASPEEQALYKGLDSDFTVIVPFAAAVVPFLVLGPTASAAMLALGLSLASVLAWNGWQRAVIRRRGCSSAFVDGMVRSDTTGLVGIVAQASVVTLILVS